MITSRPTHPGITLHRVAKELNISQGMIASALSTSRFTINQIMGGKRSVTADMALRLEYVLGISAEIWMNLQMKIDLYDARLHQADKLTQLTILRKKENETS